MPLLNVLAIANKSKLSVQNSMPNLTQSTNDSNHRRVEWHKPAQSPDPWDIGNSGLAVDVAETQMTLAENPSTPKSPGNEILDLHTQIRDATRQMNSLQARIDQNNARIQELKENIPDNEPLFNIEFMKDVPLANHIPWDDQAHLPELGEFQQAVAAPAAGPVGQPALDPCEMIPEQDVYQQETPSFTCYDIDDSMIKMSDDSDTGRSRKRKRGLLHPPMVVGDYGVLRENGNIFASDEVPQTGSGFEDNQQMRMEVDVPEPSTEIMTLERALQLPDLDEKSIQDEHALQNATLSSRDREGLHDKPQGHRRLTWPQTRLSWSSSVKSLIKKFEKQKL